MAFKRVPLVGGFVGGGSGVGGIGNSVGVNDFDGLRMASMGALGSVGELEALSAASSAASSALAVAALAVSELASA